MKNKNNSKHRKDTWLPIILGVLMIAAVIGLVLFLSNMSEKASESAGDGELVDYEEQGTIKLADYNNPGIEILDEKESDDPPGAFWDDYVEKCSAKKLPQDLVDEAYSDTRKEYEGFAEVTGTTYEELLNEYGMTEDTVLSVAEDTVKGRLAAKTIAIRESITIDDSVMEEKLMDIMGYEEEDREPLDDLIKDYVENYGRRPRDDVYVEVVKQWLFDREKGKNS
ncbi:MAG: hypothetical protein J5819_02885 [Eubacterium sp.]|nr:hypothetical protein [Eubacterium sp.]